MLFKNYVKKTTTTKKKKTLIPPYIDILYYVTAYQKAEKKCFQKAIENLLKQKKGNSSAFLFCWRRRFKQQR